MFWMRAGSSNSVELWLLDGKLLTVKKWKEKISFKCGINKKKKRLIKDSASLLWPIVYLIKQRLKWRYRWMKEAVYSPEVFHRTITVKIREVAADAKRKVKAEEIKIKRYKVSFFTSAYKTSLNYRTSTRLKRKTKVQKECVSLQLSYTVCLV